MGRNSLKNPTSSLQPQHPQAHKQGSFLADLSMLSHPEVQIRAYGAV